MAWNRYGVATFITIIVWLTQLKALKNKRTTITGNGLLKSLPKALNLLLFDAEILPEVIYR
jgi:hypothetical protein